MNLESFINTVTIRPRTAPLENHFCGQLRNDQLSLLLDRIWESLLARLAQPIEIVETIGARTVTFMGCARFVVSCDTGAVEVSHLSQEDGSLGFVVNRTIAIDLPLRLTGFWLDAYLASWPDEAIACCVADQNVSLGALRVALKRELQHALARSTHWPRLRHAVRDAIALDRQLLCWIRHGRHRYYRFFVDQCQYNGALKQRPQFEQLVRENPNLLWLYNFALEQGVELVAGDVVAALRTRLLHEKGITPAAWRYLGKCTHRHFAHLIHWIDPDGGTGGRWTELRYWLRFIALLRRREPIAPAVMRIFDHDSFDVDTAQQLIKFRSVWLKPAIVRSILAEAERCHANGTLAAFVEDGLVEVMTWLEAESPVLDANQMRQGWHYLAKSAVAWRTAKEAAHDLQPLGWDSVLSVTSIGPWTIVPITDAWQLRQEALSMRHCADRYLTKCMSDQYRIFSIRNDAGKRVATLGLARNDQGWHSFGIRGFANRAVSSGLGLLAREVAQRYTDVWTLLHPNKESREASSLERGSNDQPIVCCSRHLPLQELKSTGSRHEPGAA